MTLQSRLIGLALSIAFLSLVIGQIKRRILRPFYMIMWLGFGSFLIIAFAGSAQLRWLSDQIFGFDDARHFFYVISFGFLFVYAFYVTIALNRLQDETRILISELGILRFRLDSASRMGGESASGLDEAVSG